MTKAQQERPSRWRFAPAGIVVLIGFLLLGDSVPEVFPENGPDPAPFFKDPLGVHFGAVYKGEAFISTMGQLGVRRTAVDLYWDEIEPSPGEYRWDRLDAFLRQLPPDYEVVLRLGARTFWVPGNKWATGTGLVPKDMGRYYKFVYETVKRTRGKVRFFENEFEFDLEKHWSGTPDEYLRSLKTFHRAVKEADPDAVVIVGGHSGTFRNGVPSQKAFVDRVLKEGAPYFDLFDLHLYGNIYDIPERVAWFRNRMNELGIDKGIVAVEYGGPTPLELPGEEGREIWAEGKKNLRIFTEGLKGYPERYRIFAMNIPRELEERRDRIQAREMAQRTVIGLSSGVRMMVWWNFTAPLGNVKGRRIIHPVFGKLSLVSPELKPKPNFDAYRRMSAQLAGVRKVVRIGGGGDDIHFYRLDREDGISKYVIWQRRDIVEGEDLPPLSYEVPTKWKKVRVTDVFGGAREVVSKDGKVRLDVTDTPLYLEEAI